MSNTKLFIGIDNGNAGATAVIDENRKILAVFKYDPSDRLCFYHKLKPYREKYESIFAFIEEPIVVYGLAHQTAPFETIGRHKMMLEILDIPYKTGSPRETAPDNWKKHLNLLEEAKSISKADKTRLSELTKELKSIEARALAHKYKVSSKAKEYICPEEQKLREEYKQCKSEINAIKSARKTNIKQLSVTTCLRLFPEAEKYLKKEKAKKYIWDDDMAEALLLAECGRIVYAKN